MTTVEEGITTFLDHRRLTVSASTLALYTFWLCSWKTWWQDQGFPTELEHITIKHFRAYFLYLTNEHIPHATNWKRPASKRVGLSPSSLDTVYRVLSAYWRFQEGEGELNSTQTNYFRDGRVPRPSVPERASPLYDQSLIDALLDVCDQMAEEEERLRNKLIIWMLRESGMRISELCRLQDEQINQQECSACIHGKGEKLRHIFWGPKTARYLAMYLRFRRGSYGGPLFRGCSVANNGGPLTTDTVRSLFRRLAKRAGVQLPKGAPLHAFRHTFAHSLLDAGVDGLDVQQFLGHASYETTQRYVRRHPGKLRRIHASVFKR